MMYLDKFTQISEINKSDIIFSKLFYIIRKINNEYKLLILNFRCTENKIFLYKIHENKKKLINIFDINISEENSYSMIYNNIRLNTSWSKISIPNNDSLHIYNIDDIHNNKLTINNIKLKINENKKIAMDNSIDIESIKIESIKTEGIESVFNTFIFDDKIIRVYYIDEYVVKIEALGIENDINKIFTFYTNPLKYISFSSNGNYLLAVNKKDTHLSIFNLDAESKENRFIINYSTKHGNKWIISNDGNIILNKYDTDKNSILKIIILNKNNMTIYSTEYILENKNISIMLNEVIISDDLKGNIISFLDDINKRIMSTLLIDCTMSEPYTFLYNSDDKINTNGYIFIFKCGDEIKAIDLYELFKIPLIDYQLKHYRNLFKNNNLKNNNDIIIGNNTTRKQMKPTENISYILGEITDNEIIMDTFDTLDIPIIEESDELGNNSGMELDSLDLFFSIIDDESKIDKILNKIKVDKLWDIKIGLLINTFIDIVQAIDIELKHVILSKYFELCILRLTIIYKSINNNINKKIIDRVINFLHFYKL